MASKPRRKQQKEDTEMDNLTTASDADLASLGLDTETPVEAAPAAEPTVVDTASATEHAAEAATEESTVKAKREHVDVGTIELEEDVPLAPLTRQTGGSKYRFDDLRAPVKKEDGTFSYASFKVDLLAGVDEGKLRRSVQSATTQANRQAKGGKAGFEGKDVYFITRSVTVAGKFAGIRVYRVDGTVAKEG